MLSHYIILTALIAHAFAVADPLITAAAQLAPRADDPTLVGYISHDGGYSDVRNCDYTETISTSGGFVQCCPTTGSCPFYTSCSGNTLIGGDATVSCDFDAALTCNTALVLPTEGASNQGQYLACWQKTLGSSPFTFVQDTGSASGGASTTRSGATSTRSSSDSETTGSTIFDSSPSSGPTSSSSSNAAVERDAGLAGGLVGAGAMLVQMLL